MFISLWRPKYLAVCNQIWTQASPITTLYACKKFSKSAHAFCVGGAKRPLKIEKISEFSTSSSNISKTKVKRETVWTLQVALSSLYNILKFQPNRSRGTREIEGHTSKSAFFKNLYFSLGPEPLLGWRFFCCADCPNGC